MKYRITRNEITELAGGDPEVDVVVVENYINSMSACCYGSASSGIVRYVIQNKLNSKTEAVLQKVVRKAFGRG
jgi:uncharacterized protein (UPF0218 family)